MFARDRTRALTQLASADACVSENGSGDCARGVALRSPTDVTISRDGRSVYVTPLFGDAVAAFARDGN